jgi:hypothetical protein
VTTPTIELPPLAMPVDELWHVLLDLGEQLTVGWALVGGQMVLLHALEHGRVPPQISQDGDIVADVRTRQSAVHDVVAALEAAGFEPDIPSAEGIAHRYSRPAEPRPVVVDVLGPEGLPADTQLLVTAPPNRTIEVPGGTQALARMQVVTVVHEGRVGHLPRPTLLAAIVLKAAASAVDHDPARHLRDLALLCALVEDPFEMREQLTRKDLRRLRQVAALHDPAHPVWALVPEDIRSNGRAAFSILTG